MPKETDGDPSSVACGINARELKDTDGDLSSVATANALGTEAMNKLMNQEGTGKKMHVSRADGSGMAADGTGTNEGDTGHKGLGADAVSKFVNQVSDGGLRFEGRDSARSRSSPQRHGAEGDAIVGGLHEISLGSRPSRHHFGWLLE